MKKKVIIFLIIILGIFLASWVIKPENLREIKEKVRNIFFENQTTSSYNAKSLILVDLSNDESFISKNADEKQVPASLAKLFNMQLHLQI